MIGSLKIFWVIYVKFVGKLSKIEREKDRERVRKRGKNRDRQRKSKKMRGRERSSEE